MIYYNTKGSEKNGCSKERSLLLSLISSRFKKAAWICSQTPLYMYCLHQYFHSKPPISGHYRPTSETPLRWCFGCGPIVVHLYVFTVSTFVDYFSCWLLQCPMRWDKIDWMLKRHFACGPIVGRLYMFTRLFLNGCYIVRLCDWVIQLSYFSPQLSYIFLLDCTRHLLCL